METQIDTQNGRVPAAWKRPPALRAPSNKHRKGGTCPEKHRGTRIGGVRHKSQWRRAPIGKSPRRGAHGGRRAAPRLRRAAELGHRRHSPARPRAARPSQRSSKHDFPLLLLSPPRGTARPRGCPRGLSHSQERPSPESGVQGQPAPHTRVRYREASPESGECRERAPDELARPTHVLGSPPRPPARARALPPDPLFQTPPLGPAGREPRSHPRSLRRRTSTGRGPTTSRRSSATA